MSQYIELHSRSAFSFLEGSSLPESLISRCAELKMSAMALLDHDGVYGAPRFHMAAKKAGIKAHIGAEVTYETSLRSRLPLLIASRAGYQNLCRLITKMKLRAAKDEGAVSEQELEEYSAGLICLTGGDDGPLALALKHGGIELRAVLSSSWPKFLGITMSMSNCSDIFIASRNYAIVPQ
jgi:error-prone DNA polymerase